MSGGPISGDFEKVKINDQRLLVGFHGKKCVGIIPITVICKQMKTKLNYFLWSRGHFILLNQ